MTKFYEYTAYETAMKKANLWTYDAIIHKLESSLFGDGAVILPNGGVHAVFSMTRSEKHIDDVLLMASLLEMIRPGVNVYYRPEESKIGADGIMRNNAGSWRIKTQTHQVFTDLYKRFYDENTKRRTINKEALDNFNIYSVASIYSDDGYLATHSGVALICTDHYTLDEVTQIHEAVCRVTNLPWVIVPRSGADVSYSYRKSDGGKMYRLYLPRKYSQEFFELIRPFTLDSFLYKLATPLQTKSNLEKTMTLVPEMSLSVF